METARVTLRYGHEGASIVSASLVDADPPPWRFRPTDEHAGAWVEIKDASDRTIYASPLPDPRLGSEVVREDGTLERVEAETKAESFVTLEVPAPGQGASIRVHLADAVPADVRSFRMTEIAALELEPTAPLRTFEPDLTEHPSWGAANPRAVTLLFLPDGFTLAEMPAFRTAVEKVKARIAEVAPFSQMLDAMRVAHVEIASEDSGIGKMIRNTPFRGHFTIDRVIEIDQSRAAAALEHYMSGRSAVALVAANTTVYGGSGGTATVFSLHPDWMSEIAMHELGHSWFKLADEYSATGQAATMEPVEANVCSRADYAHLKWRNLVSPGVPLPTFEDVPPGVIGAFEGGKYREQGIFRASFDCRMRTPGQPFCPVCRIEIEAELHRHLPSYN